MLPTGLTYSSLAKRFIPFIANCTCGVDRRVFRSSSKRVAGCGAQHPHRRNRRQRSAAAPGAGGVLRVSVPRDRGAVTRQRSACGLVDAPALAVSTSRGILRRAPPLSRPYCPACIAPPEAVAREEHQGTTLEVNARARRKPTQLGNRGGVQDVMRACAPASGRWEGSRAGEG